MTAARAARPPRIVIAAGGTAGHVVPALAIADALRAEGAEVVFAGGERAEAQLVPAAGYELEPLTRRGHLALEPAEGGARGAARGAARSAPRGRILARHGADAVLGGGGYVAGPVGLAALTRRIPVVLTEADSHLGLTNRLLAPRARRVCLAFPIAGREGERYLVTGRPVPPTVGDRAAARAAFGIPPRRDLRARVRRLARRALDQPRRRRGVRRRAVPRPPRRPARATSPSSRRAGRRTTTCASTSSPFGSALAAADLAVARAGG